MALVAVIVAMTIALALFAIWMRTIVRERQRSTMRQIQMQSARLAEAGLSRARAMRNADPLYDGETWKVDAASLGGSQQAEVRIQLTPLEDTGRSRCEVTAVYPAGVTRKAQVTRQTEFTAPNPGTDR
jgi:Tfp pilus assembly protein PilV